MFLQEYFYIFSFLVLSTLLAIVLYGLSYILSPKNFYAEKLSAYECGFEPFDEARATFQIKFYLVAILFIIFDLEVVFLFPWAVALGDIIAKDMLLGFWSMIIFLIILTVGFIYEWRKGALEWE